MNESAFQLQFEDLMNDYNIEVVRGESVIIVLRKMYRLIGTYIDDYEKELYRDKCPENGAD